MALELFQNRRRRSFFDNFAEDAAPTDLQPSPSGYPSLVRAPRMQQPELLAPAPRPGEAWINGSDVGVRTNHFPNQSISAPAPGQVVAPGGGIAGAFPGRPSRAYGGNLVQARSVPVPYAEQFRREHERPEAPERKGIGWKRGLLAVGLGTLAGMGGDSGAAARTAENVLYGPYRRKYTGYERDVEEYERGLEEARERDIGEGRRIQRELGQERLSRLRLTPMPTAGETEAEAFERRKREATDLGLEAGSPEYLEYVSERDLGFAPRQPEKYTRTLPGGESELLERRLGEDYYRPAQMLAPGVRELAQPTTITGVGGQEMELPAPPPPTERVVSYPRPTRPSVRDVSAEINSMVEGTATDALKKANGDPNRAIAIVNASENIPPEHKQKVRNRIREKVRPGASTQQGGLEEEINQALQGLTR